MAVLASIATGNFTAAGTWGLVDSTSYLNAESATESLLTTAYSATRSAAFTPGAIVVSHIGVKLCERIGTTGTMSVHMILSSDNSEVAGTEVTINVADLPSALEVDLNGGWVMLKLASPVTLLAATAYKLEAKTSSTTQVDLFCDATADNICRALITTTTQAPVAGDDMIICGEYTGTGTSNSFTVTMNQTATTDYGAASTSLITPALAICSKGTLTWETTAATQYNLKLSGNLIIYSGGTMNMGTVATPCPRDSSMTLTFDCVANVDFGLTVRNLGTLVTQGQSRTSGKNFVSCKLNTDEAIGQTTLGVDTDTGWLSGDFIAIAPTTRTASQSELGFLSGAAGASTITVFSGLTYAHSGTSPTQAEVVLLSRNVIIKGASASLQSFVDIKATATVDCDWTLFNYLGSATALKRGITIATTTGSCNIQYCALWEFSVTGSMGFNITSTSGSGITISNNVTWFIDHNHLVNVSSAGVQVVNNNIFIKNVSSQAIVSIVPAITNFTNNTCTGGEGAASNGITLISGTYIPAGYFDGNTFHSNNGSGININASFYPFDVDDTECGRIENCTVWRNNSTNGGLSITSGGINVIGLYFENLTMFGNNTCNIGFLTSTVNDCTFDNLVSNGDSTFATTYGIQFTGPSSCNMSIINSDFGTVAGIKTAHTSDLNISSVNSYQDVKIINTYIDTAINNQNLMSNPSIISSQKHNRVAGSHIIWKRAGGIERSTAVSDGSGESMKMLPLNNNLSLISSGHFGGFKVGIANGQTCTPSVKVYQATGAPSYRPKLYVKRNDALGITADTLLDTATAASDLAWETLTGTTAAVTDDGTLEFYIIAATNYNLYVDTFTAVNA